MYLKNNKSTIYIRRDKDLSRTPVLFLHGFTGSSQSWKIVREKFTYPSMAIDVPGHGKSVFNNVHDSYHYQDFVSELFLVFQKLHLTRIHLYGYSMGGRLCVAFAAKYPQLVKSLTLESSCLGIEDYTQRKEVYNTDMISSSTINDSLDDFIIKWEENDLFIHQQDRNKEEFLRQRGIRKSHDTKQLSKSLTTFSKGTMPSFIEEFQNFDFPIFLINGTDDSKYIKESRNMLRLNKNATQYIINKASHNTHLENYNDYISTLNNLYLPEDR